MTEQIAEKFITPMSLAPDEDVISRVLTIRDYAFLRIRIARAPRGPIERGRRARQGLFGRLLTLSRRMQAESLA